MRKRCENQILIKIVIQRLNLHPSPVSESTCKSLSFWRPQQQFNECKLRPPPYFFIRFRSHLHVDIENKTLVIVSQFITYIDISSNEPCTSVSHWNHHWDGSAEFTKDEITWFTLSNIHISASYAYILLQQSNTDRIVGKVASWVEHNYF